jgi:predicted ATPase
MLRNLTLINFKSFCAESIRFSNLTVLAGPNGAGKSTIAQAILLLKQIDSTGRIHLNGDFVQLGDSNSLLYKWANNDAFSIELKWGKERFQYMHVVNQGGDVDVLQNVHRSAELKALAATIRYLSADRVVPADTFLHSTDKVTQRDLGRKGENAIAFYAANRSALLPIRKLAHPNDAEFGIKGTYQASVDAWLQEISIGARTSPERLAGMNLAKVTFGYGTRDSLEGISSYNVGFGLTYVLPVILLALSSRVGDFLILENPEAHVHPAGQVALGMMLAQVANAGVQILLETHSDHIFNGIRLYIKEKGASTDRFAFFFCDRKPTEEGFETLAERVDLFPDGKIKFAPSGFFDTWESAVYRLI